ncbi:LysR family transcriptional regulator [Pseudomonas fontis]|uniref:LysR family transcriptional regulator n=1 Tax=Pseudomonas fontis TaxID=2942633 RepID=A0ABT5NYZ9_9PSED|nr:LysR family transcriptional regulator [Pseudomonas fontis]MDD0977422.1 LysR family transcriptional regulator [Pseudomonas fontis]MDD0993416.1 LysR family transcriptional regulator [Pseudomonas fontis]
MFGQLHDLDLHLLRLFVTVVEAGGFSAAQGALGLSQPSISQHMARLETRLGYRLCNRGKSGFQLTAKGEALLKATRELLDNIEAFRNQANGVAGRLLGEVRIGISEALDNSVSLRLAQAIGRFRQRDESVRLELVSATPAEMERLLLQQRLDLAIGYFSGSHGAFSYRALFSETQSLYCASGHPLFARTEVSLDELQQTDRVEHPYRFLKSAEALTSGVCSARSEQVEGALTFILSGRHIGYLPQHFAAAWVERGLLRALNPSLDFEAPFMLARHRAQVPSDAQQAFEDDLLAEFG